MRSEIERCKMAFEAAAEETTAMVCSGDAGRLRHGRAASTSCRAGILAVEIEIVPGDDGCAERGGYFGGRR